MKTLKPYQPHFTDCPNCGTADHNQVLCPCACHPAPRRKRRYATREEQLLFNFMKEVL